MKTYIVTFSTLCFLLLNLHAFSQSWFGYNTFNSGLPDDDVTTIVIDTTNDVKWISTFNGLVKVEGSEWTVYNTGNSDIPDNYILSLAIDLDGNKWVGTEAGLAMFDDENWTVYTTDNSDLPVNAIMSIAIDINGDKWIGTLDGLAHFNDTDWTVYNSENTDMSEGVVLSIAVDTVTGVKWIGTADGLIKFDDMDWTFYFSFDSGLPDELVYALAVDINSNVWVGTYGGAAKFDGENWEVYNAANSELQNDGILSFFIDANEDVWIGNEGGVAIFDGEDWLTYSTTNSDLPDNDVHSIAVDAEGNKWLATLGGGVAVYNCAVTADFSSEAFGGEVTFSNNSSVGDYFWEFDDGNTSTDVNPTHVYEEDGTYEVCLSVTVDCTSDTLCKEINVVGVGIDERDTDMRMQIYPNPSSGLFNVNVQTSEQAQTDIEIYDLAGRQIYSKYNAQRQEEIDLSNSKAGIYFIRIEAGGDVFTDKLVVK